MKTKGEKTKDNLSVILILLGILLLGNLAFSLFYLGFLELPETKGNNLDVSEENPGDFNYSLSQSEALSLEGFVEIGMDLGEDVAVLINKENECEGMIVAIAPEQSFSIQQGMDSKISFRPTSHDTARDILSLYGIDVIMVKITDLHSGAYFGRLVLDDGERMSNIDVRPSDGIAIAVRMGSPIYISEHLLDEYGENIC
ncbi:MAG: bifunctional nuclease family protein [Candidatus Pacearchaeota archaeon]